MNNPDSYVKYKKIQYRDNMRFLKENIGRIKWRGPEWTTDMVNGQPRDEVRTECTPEMSRTEIAFEMDRTEMALEMGKTERVLDVGSGDGSFTANELRQALPPHCQLVGCDKSPAMVLHANTHHGTVGVKFDLVEIGKPLPDDYIGSYDHIISFFCYHWIPYQRVAFSQTYDMLREGGDCLLLILAHAPIVFDVYRWFSRSEHWSRWVKDLDTVISPYHDCEDPEMKLRMYVEGAGFKDVYVRNKKHTYTYSSEQDVKKMMTSLNPFQIPDELMGEYMDEFIRVAKTEGHLSDTLTISYSTMTLYARRL